MRRSRSAAKPTPKKHGRPARKYEAAWVQPFLETLRNSGNVRLSCERSGVDRATAYRRRSLSAWFRRRWDVCLEEAIDAIEATAFRLSTVGAPQWTWGRKTDANGVVTFERLELPQKVEPALIVKLLSSHRPDLYGKPSAVEVSGQDGRPIEVSGSDKPAVVIVPAPGADYDETMRLIDEAKRKSEGDGDGFAAPATSTD